MKSRRSFLKTSAAIGAMALGLAQNPAAPSQTDIAQAPLGTAPTATVLPNLMFILDDAESMASDHMPDQVNDANTAKSCTPASCDVVGATNAAGFPPYYAAPFNTIYYNPQITYLPGVDSSGASLGNATPAAASNDPYLTGSGTKDLVTTWTDVVWCSTSTPSAAQLVDPTVCKKNGIHTTNPFTYDTTTNAAPFGGGLPTTTFRFAITINSNPHYYTIAPREHCTDETMTTCVLSAVPTGLNIVPAPVRWCRTTAAAAQTTVVSGGAPTPLCQSKVTTTYRFPRLGNITRTDIVPATYGNRPNRTDCAAVPTCTYAEELQNFANWYTYYHTRMKFIKSSAGRVFSTLDDRYRVGFVTINAASSTKYLKIDKFEPTQKAAWYSKFYRQVPSGSKPLRQALARVGRHYAGMTDGINDFMDDDPVQFSCQQNFALLTTDGYWNGSAGQKIDGTAIVNQDNVENTTAPFYVSRASGTFDGNLSGTAGVTSTGGSSETLADVAMYYYKTDLRPAPGPVSKDNVPTNSKDIAPHQHMVTFALGLGLDGLMSYRSDYETATAGDFFRIKTAASGCSWATGTCNWPRADNDDPSALDDLWHAAVNGRGIYFSAKDPTSLQSGLTNTLSSISIATGAAASSATSTPNLTPTDNFIYSSTYRTVKWDGEVVAERIDTTTGNVIPGAVWSAGAQLDARVKINSDTRTIYTLDPSDVTDKLKLFLYDNLTAAEKAHFDNKCAALPQCPSLNAGQQATVNNGSKLVDWLRGQFKKEDGVVFRDREHVLGDIVNAKPAFVGKPNLLFGDAGYSTFRDTAPANARQSVLFIPANDGMLHAFNSDTGAELWAYVPRMVMPDLHKLAGTNYDIAHRYYVDGSPAPMDVFFGPPANAWKTILVGGLNSGGRGYYALDITDPNNPKGLWEICSDSSLCAISDTDLGLSYGQAIITKRPFDGKWVVIVTSGYNNVTPGTGGGFLYVLDAETGAVLSKSGTELGGTNVGTMTTPSGFAKISGFATNFAVDNTTTVVYGGDLLGNVWRFEMSGLFPSATRIAQLKDDGGKPQSVTTRPEITRFTGGFNVVYVGTGRLLGSSDLQDPATLGPPEPFAYQQTVYAFKDTGADLGDLRQPAANLLRQTLTVIDAVTRSVSSPPTTDVFDNYNGWFVDFNPGAAPGDSPGERVNIDMQLVRGVLLVATNEPNSEPCSTGGDSFFYQFDYRSGSYVASSPGGVVGTKLSSALAAGFVVYRLPSGQLKFTEINVNSAKKTGGVNPGGGGALGKRVSWRELIL